MEEKPKIVRNKRIKKYYKGVMEGKTKTQAKLDAGYSPKYNTDQIERTDNFRALSMRDELAEIISKKQIAEKLRENIYNENGNVSNKAIEIALRVQGEATEGGTEQVMVVFKK